MTPKPLRTQPQLVLPTAPTRPGATPAYERGILLGAIRVRRDLADEYRYKAGEADRAGDDGAAFRFHVEADRSEAEIERMSREIGEIGR